MNIETVTQLTQTLKLSDVLPYVIQTREHGSAEIPMEVIAAVRILGYVRGKLNGQNVFATVERTGLRYKMHLRFHDGRGVRQTSLAKVQNDTAQPSESEQALKISPVRSLHGERFLKIEEKGKRPSVLPLAIAALCTDPRISGYIVRCTECRHLLPVRELNAGGYCDPCAEQDIVD